MRLLSCLLIAGLGVFLSVPAWPHGVAGPRVFINTLTIDDPAVADEAAFPTFTWQHAGADDAGGATNAFDFDFEFNKRITDDFGFGISDGYSVLRQLGAKTRSGWHNLSLSLKYQAYTSAEHELLLSLGVIRTFPRTGSYNIDNNDIGSTTPIFYFGKGLGDLPIGYVRPVAITGTLGYQFADKRLKSLPTINLDTGIAAFSFNNGIEDRWIGGLSAQYSFPYLQAQVKDFGLPTFINKLTPVAEVAWSSPASKPHAIGNQYLFAAGVAYGGADYAVTAETLIPGNRQTGTKLGFIAQLHLYFDDLFPTSLGKPLLPW